MAFEAKDETVGELLNKVVFSVPRNQRRYVWEKDNWDELLEDILFSCRSGKKAHFLGSIVLKDEGKKEGIARYTIIDGQQRITTITLILIAIMKLFVERKMQDEFLGTIDYVMTTNNRNQKMPILTSDYHLSLEKITNRIVELNSNENITIDALVNSCILSPAKDKKIGEAIKFFYKSIHDELEKEIALYFVIKWAVKNGIKEAYSAITGKKTDEDIQNEKELKELGLDSEDQ